MDPRRDPWSTEDEVITVGLLGAFPAMVAGGGVYLWVRQFGGPWAKQLEPHMAISLQAAAGLTAVGAVFATVAASRYVWSRGLIGEAVTDGLVAYLGWRRRRLSNEPLTIRRKGPQ